MKLQCVLSILTDIANASAGRFLLGRIDIDASPRIAQALQVQAVPIVMAVIAGQFAPLAHDLVNVQSLAGASGSTVQSTHGSAPEQAPRRSHAPRARTADQAQLVP